MRLLPAALLTAQQEAPFRLPHVRIRISEKRAGVHHPTWTSLYSDATPVGPHDAFAGSEDDLFQLRINPADDKLYRRHTVTPHDPDNFGAWTDWGVTAHACAVAGDDLDLVAVAIANGSPFHVFYATSGNGGATWSGWTDTGMVSDTNGHVAVAFKNTTNYTIFYTRGAQLYVRELRAASWQAESSSAYTFTSITGVAAYYSIDYNLAITGEDASTNPGVWCAIFGNGFNFPLGTWGPPQQVIVRGSTEDFTYLDPHLTRRNSFELTFIEHHTGTTASYIAMHTHMTRFFDYALYSFREPVPINYPYAYAPAMCAAGAYQWNCTPDTIAEASSSTAYWDITSDVVDVTEQLIPGSFRSKITVVLDNTAGKFNSFSRLGDEIVIEWGYETNSGILYSASPPSWITGWRFLSPAWFPLRSWYPYGVVGTLQIEAEDVWGLLSRWKAPRSFTWAAGAKSMFLMLAWLFSRVGLEYEGAGEPTELYNFEPELQVTAGTTARTLIKKLLSWVSDVALQTSTGITTLNPQADDESVYTYDNMWGVSHLLFRGDYRFRSWDPNRVIVESDTISHEDDEFTQIAAVDDRLARVTAPDYTVEADAAARAAAELRKGQMWNAKGGWVQVAMNCGQEVFDVVTITDTSAGLTTQDFRVIGIKTHWNKKYWTCIQQLLLSDV
jgi:hypothetical protein